MTQTFRSLRTPDGRTIRLPGTEGWTPAARMAIYLAELSHAVGAPVRFAPSGIPHPGNLKTIEGRPDVLVRPLGAGIDDEHRTSLHVTEGHHRALVNHIDDGGIAFQGAIAALGPTTRGQRQLILASFPYDLVADVVDRAFAARRVPRVNFTLVGQQVDSVLALHIPEFGISVTYGLEELARVLRHGQGTPPAAMLGTAERVAVVASVLARGRGLQTTVCPLDARTKVAHRLAHLVGLPDVPPHRLNGRGMPCARAEIETLSRTDVIGASTTADLLACPEQDLVLVELENLTRDGVGKIEQRIAAAERLGLRPAHAILVVRDEDEAWFRERLARATAVVRSRTKVEPFSAWYDAYCRLRDAHVAAQRALVRRAAA